MAAPLDIIVQVAHYAYINRALEHYLQFGIDERREFPSIEYLHSLLVSPSFPAIAYAIYNNIPVRDFIEAIATRHGDSRIEYYATKLSNNKSKAKPATEAVVLAYRILRFLAKPLPQLDPELPAKFRPKSEVFVTDPSWKFSTWEILDFNYYGDGLTSDDWIEIYLDVSEQNIDIPSFFRNFDIARPGPNAPHLLNVLNKKSKEYGIHPVVIALKFAFNPQIKDLALKFVENQKLQEETTRQAAIQKALEKEIRLRKELEDIQKELETLRLQEEQEAQLQKEKRRRLEFEEQRDLERLKNSPISEPIKEKAKLPDWRSTRKPYLFIVGGESFNVPNWIKNSFEIKHATGRISGTRAAQLLGERLPDAVLMIRFAGHMTTTPVTDLARKYNIPILVAKPSISSAVKQASRYGPAWFVAAYPKELQHNPNSCGFRRNKAKIKRRKNASRN